jgi:two-component system, response regulator YesN
MFIMVITLLSYMLFYLFSTSAVKEIDNHSKVLLAQTSYASEVIYNQVTNISSQLINDNNIISFLYSSKNDKVVNYNVSTQMTKIQNNYPFIKSIGVYNLRNGMQIDTVGIPIDKNYLNKNKKKYIEIFPRKVAIKVYDREQPYELITFILFPDFSLSKSSDAAIVINIDERYILNTVTSISGVPNESTTFVMNSNGLILSHTNYLFFMKDFSTQDYIKKILNENRNQGSLIKTLDNEKHLVTYVKSNKMNWYFISIKKYNKLLSNIYQLKDITLFIVGLLIILGIIISTYLAGVIYNPIRSLIEKVGSLNSSMVPMIHKFDEYKYLSESFSKSFESAAHIKSAMHRSSLMIKGNYILNLLKGDLYNIEDSPDVLEKIKEAVISPYFCVFLFKIDNYQNFKQVIKYNDQSLFRFALCNIAQELLLKHFPNESSTPEEDEIVVIARLEDDKLPEEIYLTLTEIIDAIRKYFKFSVSISMGDILYSINDIADSYKTLKEYSKYRLFYGYECILDGDKIKAHASKSELYPFDVEKKLMDALQLCNDKLIQKQIDEFVKLMQTVNYFQAVTYFNQIIFSIIKHFDSIIKLEEDSFKSYFDVINHMNQSETMDDLVQIITGLCIKISKRLDQKNNSFNAQKHKKIIDDVKTYIQINYSNPNLSLELVSEIVELSPGYLGKLFKSSTTVSFNDYLNSVRLEKAKELLCTTNEPASKICEKVGIFNITYFSTLFKKIYGITPSQFRGTNTF